MYVLLWYLPPSQYLITTVAGSDYVAVAGEELVFNRSNIRVCHVIGILDDSICEDDPNENFFLDLAFISGMQPIRIEPGTAEVIIDDAEERECGKYVRMIHPVNIYNRL